MGGLCAKSSATDDHSACGKYAGDPWKRPVRSGKAVYERVFSIESERSKELESNGTALIPFGYAEASKKEKGEDQASFKKWRHDARTVIHAWAIFDGHGGHTTAMVCADSMLCQLADSLSFARKKDKKTKESYEADIKLVPARSVSPDCAERDEECALPQSQSEWLEFLTGVFQRMDEVIGKRRLRGGCTVAIALLICTNTAVSEEKEEESPDLVEDEEDAFDDSTAAVRRQLVVANLGDARALLTLSDTSSANPLISHCDLCPNCDSTELLSAMSSKPQLEDDAIENEAEDVEDASDVLPADAKSEEVKTEESDNDIEEEKEKKKGSSDLVVIEVDDSLLDAATRMPSASFETVIGGVPTPVGVEDIAALTTKLADRRSAIENEYAVEDMMLPTEVVVSGEDVSEEKTECSGRRVLQLTTDHTPVNDWQSVRRRAERVLAANTDGLSKWVRVPSQREVATAIYRYGTGKGKRERRASMAAGLGVDALADPSAAADSGDVDAAAADDTGADVSSSKLWTRAELSAEDRKKIPVISVTWDRGARLCHTIGVTRALGDFSLKIHGLPQGLTVKPLLSCEPHVNVLDLSDAGNGTAQSGDWLILACDGPFDTLSNEAVAEIVDQCVRQGGDDSLTDCAAMDAACAFVCKRAYATGGGDDMTAFAIPVRHLLDLHP